MSEAQLPFGKHKFKPLPEVPTEYLEWVLPNLDDRNPHLTQAIEDQLALRGDGTVSQAVGRLLIDAGESALLADESDAAIAILQIEAAAAELRRAIEGAKK